MSIRIVLTGTSHPGNIGSAARAMKNMGLERLCLVAPARFPATEATVMAAGADDVLDRLSRLKAQAVANKYTNALIIGSDQVAECNGRRLDKPGDVERAIEQLSWTSGKRAVFSRRGVQHGQLQELVTGRDRAIPATGGCN